jgi:hypothetical protein
MNARTSENRPAGTAGRPVPAALAVAEWVIRRPRVAGRARLVGVPS